jgi:hypothetical protein
VPIPVGIRGLGSGRGMGPPLTGTGNGAGVQRRHVDGSAPAILLLRVLAVGAVAVWLALLANGALAQDAVDDGVVSGRVTDTAGAPVAGIHVSVESVEDWSYGFATTDGDGRYEVGALDRAAAYRVQFHDPQARYLDQYFDGTSSFAEATLVTPSRTDVDAVLVAGVSISGSLSADGEGPLASVDIQAERLDAPGWAWASSEEDGSFLLPRLVEGGEYQLTVRDWTGTWATLVTEPIVAPATGVDLELVRAVSIVGQVRAAGSGAPLGFVAVDAIRVDGPGTVFADTRPDGTYELLGLAPGERYRLRFHDWNGVLDERWYDAAADEASATPVSAPADGIDVELTGGSTIAGRVTAAEDGAPLAGIRVQASSESGEGRATVTASDGSYVLGGLTSGVEHRVWFGEDGGERVRRYYDQASDWSGATPVTAPATGIDASLTLAATITGTVVGTDGTPLADIHVEAQPSTGHSWGATWTDEDGTYVLRGLEPGVEHRVRFDDWGGTHAPQYYDGAVTWEEATLVTAPMTGIDAVLRPTGVIRGTVSAAADGSPLEGIEVEAEPVEATGVGPAFAQTAADGTYELTGLVDGVTYRVWFGSWDGRYVAEYYDGVSSWVDATPVMAPASGIDAALVATAAISGTVAAAEDGQPLAGIQVSAEAFDGYGWRTTVTDSTGAYELTGLSPGEPYRVRFEDPEGRYRSQYYDRTSSWGDATPVVAPASSVDAVLELGSPITGRVTSAEDGSPLEGISVEVEDVSGGEWFAARTGPDGTYTLGGGVAGAVYRVWFTDHDGGFAPRYFDGATTWSDATLVTAPASGIDAALEPAAPITGSVTAAEGGAPLAGITVAAEQVDGWGWTVAESGDDGTYTLRGLAAGAEYRIRFHDPRGSYLTEYHDAAATWDLATPVTAPAAAIDAALGTAAAITGTVVSADGGSPLEDIEVRAVRLDGPSPWRSTTTTDDGSYVLGGLVPGGTYRISFEDWTGAFATQYHDGVSAIDEATAIVAPADGIDAALEGAASIAGTVTSARDGSPAGGITVWASPDGGGGSTRAATTAADGSYTVLGLQPGQPYVLEFLGDGRFHPQYYDGVTDRGDATAVPGPATGIDAALEPTASLRGTVRDRETGAGVVGIQVIASSEGGGWGASSTTLAGGAYEVVGLEEGASYRLRFFDQQGRYVSEYHEGARRREEATPIAAPASGIDADLDPAVAISGTVTDAADGTPLAGISVTVGRQDGEESRSAVTASDGTYTVRGLEAGSDHWVSFAHPRGHYVSRSYVSESGTWNDLVTAPAEAIDIALEETAIAGVVTTVRDAEPLEGIELVLRTDTGTEIGTATTGADGRYRFGGLVENERYHLEASDPLARVRGTDLAVWAPASRDVRLVEETTTSLSIEPRQAVTGQRVALRAEVNAAVTTATGSVSFRTVDGQVLATRTLQTDGTAAVELAFDPGEHELVAVFVGTSAHAPSEGQADLTVEPAVTSTRLTASPSTTIDVGDPVEVRATVDVDAPGAGWPSGEVVFELDGAPVATVPAADRVATLDDLDLTPGRYELVATYPGDDRFLASTSAPLELVVRWPTTTDVAVTPEPSVTKQVVEVSASITSADPDGTPSGRVRFYRDGVLISSSPTLDANGTATIGVTVGSPGPVTFEAVYLGGAAHGPSDAAAEHLVEPAATTTTVHLSSSSIDEGDTVDATVRVRATAPGGGLPAGTVRLRAGADELGEARLEDGIATFAGLTIEPGTWEVAASYDGSDDGSDDHLASSSEPVALVVRWATATEVTATPATSTVGTPVELEAQVTTVRDDEGAPVPTGTVTFRTADGPGARTLGSTSLTDGRATLTWHPDLAGEFTVVADFQGSLTTTPSRGEAPHAVEPADVSLEPLVAVAGEDRVVVPGGTLRLDGSASRPAGGIERYRWDLGDGRTREGIRVDVSYPEVGRYPVTLTVERVDETATASFTVDVVAPAASVDVTVVDADTGAPLSGADVLVLTAEGARHEARTDGAGVARLATLPDGKHTAYGLRTGYRAGLAAVTVTQGTGTATIALEPGELVAAVVEVERLDRDAIIAAGIDPDDPQNHNVVDFTVELGVPGSPSRQVSGLASGPSTGGGSVRIRNDGGGGGYRYWGSVSWQNDQPLLQWLVVPGQASFLREFFAVDVVVQNLSASGVELRSLTASLPLPEGLALAPTATPQTTAVDLPTIDGGGSATASWIVRGDEEGSYDLTASVDGTLWPFDAPVRLLASTAEPLEVYGASALRLRVEADEVARLGVPYVVSVALENVAPIPVYNASLRFGRPDEARYVYQPRQQLEYRADTLLPGEALEAELRLVPAEDGPINVAELTSALASGAAGFETDIELIDRDAEVPELSAVALKDAVGLLLEEIPGATDHQVFTTPDRTTPFAATPTPFREVVPGRWVIDDIAPDEPVFVAVSAIIDGERVMVHPLVEANSSEHAATTRASVEVGERGTRTCGEDTAFALRFTETFFELTAIEWQIGQHPVETRSVTGTYAVEGPHELEKTELAGGITVRARARNADGTWGAWATQRFDTDCRVRPTVVLASGLRTSVEGHGFGGFNGTWGTPDEGQSVIPRLTRMGYDYGDSWLTPYRTLLEYSYESAEVSAGPTFRPNRYGSIRTFLELQRLVQSNIGHSASDYLDALIEYDARWSANRSERLEYHLVGHSLGGAQVLQIGYELARRADACDGTYPTSVGDYPCGRLHDLVSSITTVNGAVHPRTVLQDINPQHCGLGIGADDPVVSDTLFARLPFIGESEASDERASTARAIVDLADRGIHVATLSNSYDTCLSDRSTLTTARHPQVRVALHSVVSGETGVDGHTALLRPGIPSTGKDYYPLASFLRERLPDPRRAWYARHEGIDRDPVVTFGISSASLAAESLETSSAGPEDGAAAPGGIAGRALDPAGQPEAAGSVYAFDPDGELVEFGAIGWSGGRFEIAELPAGTYRLFVNPESSTSGGAWFGGVDFDSATPVVLGEDERVDVGDVATVATHRLTVTVRDLDGDPVASAGAGLRDEVGRTVQSRATAEGQPLVFEDLPTGTYELVVAGPTTAVTTREVRVPAESAVTVAAGPAGQVRIAVKDPAGQPIVGLVATILVDGDPYAVRMSDGEGNLTFGALPPGDHEVRYEEDPAERFEVPTTTLPVRSTPGATTEESVEFDPEAAPVDVTAPTWPTDAELDVTADLTGLDVAWPAAGDDVGVVGYELRVDGGEPIATEDTAVSVDGLEPGTTYDLAVVAIDAAGNVSEPLQASATTLDPVDPVDPVDPGDPSPTDPRFVTSLLTTYATTGGWDAHLSADLTGNGRADLLSYHPQRGRWWVTSSNEDGSFGAPRLLTTYATTGGWDAHLAADVTGNGRADLLSYHPQRGRWWVTSSNEDGSFGAPRLLTTYATTGGWDAHLAADVTGNGRADLLSYHPQRGRWWVTSSNEDGSFGAPRLLTTYATTGGWDAHLAADVTGNGRADLLSYHPQRGRWWVTSSNEDGSFGAPRLLTTYATTGGWDAHLAADVTGNGRADLLSYHPQRGRWWVTSSNEDGSFGAPRLLTTYATTGGWDAHLAADVTGSGAADLLSYHPQRGRWWITTDISRLD